MKNVLELLKKKCSKSQTQQRNILQDEWSSINQKVIKKKINHQNVKISVNIIVPKVHGGYIDKKIYNYY